jgi:hypothetical protein
VREHRRRNEVVAHAARRLGCTTHGRVEI